MKYLLLALLCGCNPAQLTIECRVPTAQRVERLQVQVIEPRGTYGCDEIAFGLLGKETLSAQTTRSAEGAVGAALELGSVSASSRKLVLVSGSADGGLVVVRGCAEVDGGNVTVVAEPVVTTRLRPASTDYPWPSTPPLVFGVDTVDAFGRRVSTAARWESRFPNEQMSGHAFSTGADGSVDIDAGRPNWSGPFRVQFRVRWGPVTDFEALSLPEPTVDRTNATYLSGRIGAKGEVGLVRAEVVCTTPQCQGLFTVAYKFPGDAGWNDVLTQVKNFALFPSADRELLVAHLRPSAPISTLVTLDLADSGVRITNVSVPASENGLTVTSASDDCSQPAVLRTRERELVIRLLPDGGELRNHPYLQLVQASAGRPPTMLGGGCVAIGQERKWANWLSFSQGLVGQQLYFASGTGAFSFPMVTYSTGFRFLGPADGERLLLGSPGLLGGWADLMSFSRNDSRGLEPALERVAPISSFIPSTAVRGDFDGDGARDLAVVLVEFKQTSASLLVQLGAPPDGGLSATGRRAVPFDWCDPVLHAADLNGDGRDEIFVASGRTAPRDGGGSDCASGLYTYTLGER